MRISVECEVWSVECGVWSVECGVWSVECGVWSVEFKEFADANKFKSSPQGDTFIPNS